MLTDVTTSYDYDGQQWILPLQHIINEEISKELLVPKFDQHKTQVLQRAILEEISKDGLIYLVIGLDTIFVLSKKITLDCIRLQENCIIYDKNQIINQVFKKFCT